MLLEASTLTGLNVLDAHGQKLGTVETCVFDGQASRLAGFGVNRPGLLTKIAALPFEEVRSIGPADITVGTSSAFLPESRPFDELIKRYGRVLDVTARTESNERIGKVTDVLVEAETGLLVRFYLRHLLREQIIPRQFAISLSPQAVVFQDIVNRPTFNQAATAKTG